jgi:hypothetical protein
MGWRELLGLNSKRLRTHGRPPSGNGASSFHLFWDLPTDDDPIVEVSASFELLDQPRVQRLYFWALQVNFGDRAQSYGGGHFGFQWHPSYPDSRAVCWGGYANVGGELSGGPTSFPSIDGNPNVCGYEWTVGVPWTWRIRRIGDGDVWRAEFDDPSTGVTVAIRDLNCRGDRLSAPMVWSEVFAHCDDPSVRVRWSNFAVRTAGGLERAATGATVNYQSYEDGGCSNTDVVADGTAVVQVTNTERHTPQGATVRLIP